MNIDIESKTLLTLILEDSPKDRQFILCILALAKNSQVPTRIFHHSNTEYPTFYGYVNEKIPLYLMGVNLLSNVPRVGFAKRLITANNISLAEAVINKAKNWDVHQKLEYISKLITLNNRTSFVESSVYLFFRDKAEEFINVNKTQSDLADNKEKSYGLWLEGQGKYFTDKLWQVVRWLHVTQELIGSHTFQIPLELFKRKKVNLEEAKKLIINLENKKLVSTFHELSRTPPTDDPNKPSGSVGQSVVDKEEVFYDSKTTITLSHEFKYLYKVLEKRYEKLEISQPTDPTKVDETPNPPFGSVTPKQSVRQIVNDYKFPKKQKRLIMKLSNFLPIDTKILESKVDTRDLSSLKKHTLETIKSHGLSDIISIESIKKSFDKYFYQLKYTPAGAPKT